jgi:UDPglucose 6-dehydrogenase
MSRVVIVGSGVVGTATGKGFARKGHEVTFVDIDPARLEALSIEGYEATQRPDLSRKSSFVFLTLPTPAVGYVYDLSAFAAGTRSVGKWMRESNGYHTVVVRSTVPPGTCDGLVRPLLEEASGKRAGKGFGLACSPEFLRAASAEQDFMFPWMTIIASPSRRTVESLHVLFRPFGGEIRTFSKMAEAEVAKCYHNLFNATKISFWNEMWRMSRHLGLDPDPIASAVSRSAEGSINPDYGIRGGRPYRGACLPKDTRGFLGFASQEGIDMPLLSAVLEVNAQMERLEAETSESPEPQELPEKLAV